MSTDQPNPYAAPQQVDVTAPPGTYDPNVDRATLNKIEAVIKDAGQFWMAILLCFVCTGFGAIIIGPWYLIRLMQWHKLAQDQPMLLDTNVARGSIAQRFQSAKVKLIIGISFGALMLGLVALYFFVLIIGAAG